MTTASPFAGERIRAVRHLLGLSQAELASATGRTQASISQVESGARSAADDLVDAVAAATGTPRAFFDAPPVDLPEGSLRFRKRSTALRSETKRVRALLSEAYRVGTDLYHDARLHPPPLPSVDSAPNAEDIEGLAQETRAVLGLGPDGPVPNVIRACERAGIVVVPLALPGGADTIGHDGVSYWSGSDDPPIVGFLPLPGDRLRWTVAHEVGHFVLHIRRRVIEDAEGEAHRFAGAFMFPERRAASAFRGPVTLTTLCELKARWGISIAGLIQRGYHLGYIDASRRIALFKQLGARGWRRNEPVTVDAEQPVLFHRLLERRGPVSYSKLGDQLGLPPVVLRSLARTG